MAAADSDVVTGSAGQKRAEMMVAEVVAMGASRCGLRAGDMACMGMFLMLPFTRLLSAMSFSITCTHMVHAPVSQETPSGHQAHGKPLRCATLESHFQCCAAWPES